MRQIMGDNALYLYTDKKSKHQHLPKLYLYDQSASKGRALRIKGIPKHVETGWYGHISI